MKRFLCALFCIVYPLNAHATPVQVVASFSILGDIVQAIGGDAVQVHALVGRNSDVHAYNATPKDLALVKHAQLVVLNGLELEGWLERILTNTSNHAQSLVLAKAALPYGLIIRQVDGENDPHIWNDPRNGIAMAQAISAALQKIDAPHAAQYQQRTTLYVQNLQRIDDWARALLQQVPAQNKRILCTHDSFGYLATAYDLTFITPVRLSTKDSPTAQDIAKVVRQVKQQKISAAFLENSNDPRMVRQLSHDAGVAVGGTLYPESLSEANEPAATYVQLLQYNIATIARALLPQTVSVVPPVQDSSPPPAAQ